MKRRKDAMTIRTATAEWYGDLAKGSGRMRLGTGAFNGCFDLRSRMDDGPGTNPEELLGAAHAGCFSMALAHQLSQAGYSVERIETTAKVHFERDKAGGWSIPLIELTAEARAHGISTAVFAEQAEKARKNCPVSKALASVDIRLNATLVAAAA